MPLPDIIFWLAVAFVIAINLSVAPKIASERIALQWGRDGQPTWFARKRLAIWGTIAFMLAVRVAIWAAATYAPHSVNHADLGVIGFSLTVAVAHLFIVTKAIRQQA